MWHASIWQHSGGRPGVPLSSLVVAGVVRAYVALNPIAGIDDWAGGVWDRLRSAGFVRSRWQSGAAPSAAVRAAAAGRTGRSSEAQGNNNNNNYSVDSKLRLP